MAGVSLTGHTTWDAKAKERRESDTQTLLDTYGLTPDDVIRFPKAPGSTAKTTAKPLSVGADGSVTCSAGGRLRAIAAEKIEVKGRGPRGGTTWTPLIKNGK